MAFDGIVTAAMAHELREKLLLGKIEKVYQPEPDELVFHIHTKNGKHRLYMSAASDHARMHLITENPPNPPVPLAFCMLLRKHLQGGRITDITQKDSERIIEITLETLDELGFTVNKRLVIEIMGKHSNIILVDLNTGKIMDSIKRVSIDVNRARQVLPGKTYEYPPAQDKVPYKEVTPEYLQDISRDPKSMLGAVGGISPAIAQLLAGSDDPYETLKDIRVALTSGTYTPCVYLKEDGTLNCVISTEELTSEELVAFCAHARKKYYLRPWYILHRIKRGITDIEDLKRSLKAFSRLKNSLFKKDEYNG